MMSAAGGNARAAGGGAGSLPTMGERRHRRSRPRGQGQGPARLLRRAARDQGDRHRLPRQRGDRDHRAVGLRASRRWCAASTGCTRRSPAPARRAASRSTSSTSTAPSVDVTAVRRLIGMVFQKPNPFPTMSIFDNVAAGLRLTGTKSDNLRERVHRALQRGRPVGRGQGPPQRARDRAVRRPAAAPVHRPHDRDRARGDPDGRAGLGARPDRDAEGRGADRRAQGALHDRDRHPQHAAGGARRRTRRCSCSTAR